MIWMVFFEIHVWKVANETELEVSKKCEKSVRDEAARYFHGPKKDVASMYYTLACSHRYVYFLLVCNI